MTLLKWWQRGLIDKIAPISFQDSNADGVGDLAGLCQRLDYVSWLGITAIWLSPIAPSPMRDFGTRRCSSRSTSRGNRVALLLTAHAIRPAFRTQAPSFCALMKVS